MELPEYITTDEVKRICEQLDIRDWTQLGDAEVTIPEAERIRNELGAESFDIPVEVFRGGLQVELEHGIRFSDANITNNHPILTGKIVLAHLKELADYYERLQVAELEGDLLKAIRHGDAEKSAMIATKLTSAREKLVEIEKSQLK